MLKELIRDWLELQIKRLDDNQCSAEEINKAAELINTELDSSISRKDAMEHFNVDRNRFDTEIHRKMPPKGIKRNIVMYSYSKLYKIFGKKNK